MQDLQLLFYGPSRYDDSKCLNPETVNFVQEEKQKQKQEQKEREARYDLGCTQVIIFKYTNFQTMILNIRSNYFKIKIVPLKSSVFKLSNDYHCDPF